MMIPTGLLSVGAGLIHFLQRAVPRGVLPRRWSLSFVLLFAASSPSIPNACAHGGSPIWMSGFNGPANDYDAPAAIALDGSGNVIVTGYSERFYGTNEFDGFTTIKYSNDGVALWTNFYHGTFDEDDLPQAMAVDPNGNVFVTGWALKTNNLADFATVGYSAVGVPLWTNRFHGTGQDEDFVEGIAADKNGNVFVTGHSFDTNDQPSYTTIKYSLAGVPQWTNHFTGPGNSADYSYGVATDTNGNVYVTGGSGAVISYNFATIKYSGAGVPVWTNYYNAPSNSDDEAHYIVLDKSGNVFVTGNSFGSGYDFATVGYTSAGVPLWTNRYSGPGAKNDFVRGIAVDTNGNVFVTGSSRQTNGFSDFATVGYSAAGVPLWTNRFHGANTNDDSGPNGIATDSRGNVFVTGFAEATNDFADMVTIAYSGIGTPQWTNIFNGPTNGDDSGAAVASDAAGNLFVTGTTTGVSGDFVTIKYSQTFPAVQIAIESDGAVGYYIRFTGVAGVSYRLQRATNVTGPWASSSPQTALASGQVLFWDFLPPPGQGYYRISQP